MDIRTEKIHDSMDGEGRATQEAKAEELIFGANRITITGGKCLAGGFGVNCSLHLFILDDRTRCL